MCFIGLMSTVLTLADIFGGLSGTIYSLSIDVFLGVDLHESKLTLDAGVVLPALELSASLLLALYLGGVLLEFLTFS